VRQADFDDPASLTNAFTGADRLLLISTDALDEPGKRLRQHVNAVKAAEEVGVQHVIYTSIVEAPVSPITFAPDHANTERALLESSLGWTILRENLYMDLLLSSLSQAYQLGGLFNAADEGRVAYVTREDIAHAATVALASAFKGQRTLNITGPEALSYAEIAALASEITGQPLNHIPIELEAEIQAMVGAGLPRPVAEAYASIDVAIAQGKLAEISDDFETLVGRKPTRAVDFLTMHKEALRYAITNQ
jgi:NAD(P)H dehydrogenase (quinone)